MPEPPISAAPRPEKKWIAAPISLDLRRSKGGVLTSSPYGSRSSRRIRLKYLKPKWSWPPDQKKTTLYTLRNVKIKKDINSEGRSARRGERRRRSLSGLLAPLKHLFAFLQPLASIPCRLPINTCRRMQNCMWV